MDLNHRPPVFETGVWRAFGLRWAIPAAWGSLLSFPSGGPFSLDKLPVIREEALIGLGHQG
jgi:hypothetical protein